MKKEEEALLERMRITEQEVDRRKELAGLGIEEVALLVSCGPLIEEQMEEVIDQYFQVQSSDQEIAGIIGDAETVRRLHAVQRQYILDLFSGRTDISYVNNRLRIGLVHKRIGVEPKLYLSGVRVLKEILCRALQRRINDTGVLALSCQAVEKQLYFDVTLVFDAYTRSLISEVESAKERVEGYAATLEIQVAQRTRQLEEKVGQLQAALATVKKLEGIIPICGVCKKIRDDKQSWQQMEQYISEHTEALFSHGLCPDCFEKEMTGIRVLKEAKKGTKSGLLD